MKKLSVVFLACLMGVSLAVASGNQNAPRVIRVTMNDGTIHEFLVESVQNMTRTRRTVLMFFPIRVSRSPTLPKKRTIPT